VFPHLTQRDPELSLITLLSARCTFPMHLLTGGAEVRHTGHMHVLFDPQGRPFLLGSQKRWELEPNAFLAKLSIVSGRTNSPRTWRSYAYQLADWLSFCEKAGLEWRRVTELNIATYRNILGSELSPQTGRPLKRTTINHKLSVICGFYLFVHKIRVDRLTSVRTGSRSSSLPDLRRSQAAGNAGCRLGQREAA
jgi:site-specific recombinase XerD